MENNEALIHHFYKSFQNKAFQDMQKCYAEDATFTDEVFISLNALETRAMWEMLIKSGKDLQIEFKNIKTQGKSGSAEWVATYIFSKTGRKVVNHIKSNFEFAEGKIVGQIDQFNFYTWAKQALGLTGILLGWTSFMRKKVQRRARKSLENYQKHIQNKL